MKNLLTNSVKLCVKGDCASQFTVSPPGTRLQRVLNGKAFIKHDYHKTKVIISTYARVNYVLSYQTKPPVLNWQQHNLLSM